MEIRLVRLSASTNEGRLLSKAELEAAFDATEAGKKIIFATFEITDDDLVSTLRVAIDVTEIDERNYSAHAYKYAERFAMDIATNMR